MALIPVQQPVYGWLINGEVVLAGVGDFLGDGFLERRLLIRRNLGQQAPLGRGLAELVAVDAHLVFGGVPDFAEDGIGQVPVNIVQWPGESAPGTMRDAGFPEQLVKNALAERRW